jgi:hypothetical protein
MYLPLEEICCVWECSCNGYSFVVWSAIHGDVNWMYFHSRFESSAMLILCFVGYKYQWGPSESLIGECGSLIPSSMLDQSPPSQKLAASVLQFLPLPYATPLLNCLIKIISWRCLYDSSLGCCPEQGSSAPLSFLFLFW